MPLRTATGAEEGELIMWVCHCRAVTDSLVRQVIAAGAHDEREIGRRCGAGTGCGSCHDELRRLCQESQPSATTTRVEQQLVGTSV